MAGGANQATRAVPGAADRARGAGQASGPARVPRRIVSEPGEAAERNAGARGARDLSGSSPAQRRSPRQQAQAQLRPARAGGTHFAPPHVQEGIERARGGGHALDAGLREQLQPHFNHELGDVRLHRDSRADVLSRAVDARAFTVGSDIFFRAGAYTPGTMDGLALLAHELTHVDQQRGAARTSEPLPVSSPGDPNERAADAAAERVVSGGRVAGLAGTGAGNRASAAILQREPKTASPRPKAPRKPVVDNVAAEHDHLMAITYVGQFYHGVSLTIEQYYKVRKDGLDNYRQFSTLKDPPSLGPEIFKSLVGVVMSKIPGWDLIQKGLEIGMFASELGALKLELEETPIPGYTVGDVERAGPSAETKEKAKKRVEQGKTTWETGKKIYETVTDVLEKRIEAAEAAKEAQESAGFRRESLTEWAKAQSAAQIEEIAVTTWLNHAYADKKLRGKMETAVQKRLGPIPIIDSGAGEILTKMWELRLYRAKYQEIGIYVSKVYVAGVFAGGGGYSDPMDPVLRVKGGLSEETRKRIAYCADVSGTDDETMVQVLGIKRTNEILRNPGARMPGEV